MNIENIKTFVRESITDVSGISRFEDNENLLDPGVGIFPADFLYIFDLIEKRFNIPFSNVLQFSTYEVMTVENMAKEIEKMIPEAKL